MSKKNLKKKEKKYIFIRTVHDGNDTYKKGDIVELSSSKLKVLSKYIKEIN